MIHYIDRAWFLNVVQRDKLIKEGVKYNKIVNLFWLYYNVFLISNELELPLKTMDSCRNKSKDPMVLSHYVQHKGTFNIYQERVDSRENSQTTDKAFELLFYSNQNNIVKYLSSENEQ